MRDRRRVEDLSIEELEHVLLVRRREERLARLRRLGAAKQAEATLVVPDIDLFSPHEANAETGPDNLASLNGGHANWAETQEMPRQHTWRERILVGIEGAALIGLIAVIASLVFTVRNLNQEWRVQQSSNPAPDPTPTALIRAAVLPGGHKPPAISGGEAQPLGPQIKLEIPTPSPKSPTRLVIPSINVDVQVVAGDDWEQLKKGAGHHIGSANPGERGNCFISGHNDIYGEIFRHLPDLKVGDTIIAYAGEQPYRYSVRATRIVEPDDVSVMYPTSAPILTLLTCYPYMIDTQRFVVIAELDN
jgi:sortase A